jgi:glycosyltransferase involved in cell wall biosynthesis
MNVCMLSNEFPPSIGGVQTHVYELSRALVAQGHAVHVVTRLREPGLPRNEDLEGIEVHREPLPDVHLFYDWYLRRTVKRLQHEVGFDLLHVHGMRPLHAAVSTGLPVVFTNHTSSFLRRMEQGGSQKRRMLRHLAGVQLVIAPSEELVQRTADTGYPGPLRFISNGVDVDRFCPGQSALRQRLGIPESAFVAVLARRLVEKNGVLYLARALSMIRAGDFHLVVAGDGADRGRFEELVARSAMQDRVHMLGAVDNTQMPEVFRCADLAILPSLMEATSIAGLEAMACGLPVVGTRVGGIPVIVEDGTNGLLVEPRSDAELAAAINRLLENRDQASRMGAASLSRARHEFSWDNIARLTLAAYLEAIASKGAAR